MKEQHSKRRLLAVIAVLVAFLFSCTRTIHIELPANHTVIVVSMRADYPSGNVNTKEISLQPGSDDYERLKSWIANNQSGWSQSYATNPGEGIFIHCGEAHLQFIHNTVFVFAKGQSQKEIKEADYAFLRDALERSSTTEK